MHAINGYKIVGVSLRDRARRIRLSTLARKHWSKSEAFSRSDRRPEWSEDVIGNDVGVGFRSQATSLRDCDPARRSQPFAGGPGCSDRESSQGKLRGRLIITAAITASAALLIADTAFAGGGNPITQFLQTCVTTATTAGAGIATLGAIGAFGAMGMGHQAVVGPALKAGGSGAGIAGASQLVNLVLPGAGAGASLDLSQAMSAAEWVRILISAVL